MMVMISMLLVCGVLFAVVPSVFDSSKTNREVLTISQVCRESVQNIMATIQSNGVQAKTFRAPIDSTSVSLNDRNWHEGRYGFNQSGVQSEVGAVKRLGGARWPAQKIISWSRGDRNYKLHTPLLIQSSVNALLSIYNSANNRVCTEQKGLPIRRNNTLRELMPQSINDNYQVSASLRVRPYNLNTGDIVRCSPHLGIRPYAAQEPPTAVAHNIVDLSDYRSDRGLEAEVFVTVWELNVGNGEERKSFDCSSIERFQFERRGSLPPPPIVEFNGERLVVSIPHSDFDPGTHVVCRASHTFFSSMFRRTRSYTGPWLPCDRIRVCGRDGAKDINRREGTISQRFSIPNNCMANVEARVFDVTGNLSSVGSDIYYRGSPPGPSPPYDPRDPGENDHSENTDYQVGDLEFDTLEAARAAANNSGLPITEISVAQPAMDAQMNAADRGVKGANAGLESANASLSGAQGAYANAAAAAGGATNPSTSASSAAAGAAAASSAASSAQSAANSAAAAAASAQAAADAAHAQKEALGPQGDKMAKAAQKAADEAKKAAEEAQRLAEEAKRLAEEARRAAEEKKREEERRQDDD